MSPDRKPMSPNIESYLLEAKDFSPDRVRELLQYHHAMAYVLLDLKCFETVMPADPGEELPVDGLAREELAMLQRLTLPKRRREWLGGRLAAKHAAARLFALTVDCCRSVRWQDCIVLADAGGRPHLTIAGISPGDPMPSVSISHSGDRVAAMAVAKGIGGIDIQQVSPKVLRVKERFCGSDEELILSDFFSASSEKNPGILTRLWAAKEALRKASPQKSLPGFLEMELVDIGSPLGENIIVRGFLFKTAESAGFPGNQCRVAVGTTGDYVLAITVAHEIHS